MAELLRGAEVSQKLIDSVGKGPSPTLAIIRVGENESDLSYERGAIKKAELMNVNVKKIVLPLTVTNDEYEKAICDLNNDTTINGILMFRPLPKTLDEEKLRNLILPSKDVDSATDASLGGIFMDKNIGFPPCTAEAVVQILEHYNIDVAGKNVVILGRSLVIGKPVAMMLLKKNATVTICHSKTKNIEEICRNSDILISSIGKLNYITKEFTNPNQIIIDVGINFNPETNKIQGDVKFDEVADNVKMITPVPGGVGAVTSTILMKHVWEAR